MADIKPLDETPPETQALPTPYRSVPYSPQGFGAGIGASVQQAAEVFGGLARKAKSDADTTATIGAIGSVKGALNTVVLDPVKGYFSLKGDDAIKKRDDYLRAFNDAVTKAESALTNDDQRRAFAQHATTIREEAVRHVYAHESAQMEDVSKAAFAGAADQTMHTIQATVGSPDDLGKQLNDLRTLATAEGQRRFGNNPQAIQSVVAPVMQKAAIDAMEAASSSGNPDVAKGAFDRVQPYLLNHEHHYFAIVEALQQKKIVNDQAMHAVNDALSTTILPGGVVVPRLDAAKLAAAVLAVPEGPLRDQAVKTIEQRQTVFDKVWSGAVGQQVMLAEKEGLDPITGEFSLARVTPQRKLWLQENAPDKLIALRTLDARAQRQDSVEVRQLSAGNYNNLVAELIDPEKRKPFFAKMSPEEFRSYIRDEDKFPGGFTVNAEKLALVQFKGLKDAAGKLEEPIPSAVNELLKAALPVEKNRLPYVGPLHDALQRFVTDYETAHKGVAPTSAEVRQFGADELAKGSVTAVGAVPGFFDFNSVRRIDFQTMPKHADKQFNPEAGGQPETRATAAKTVRSYRYSADRKKRAPVYADGSLGPVEESP